MDSITALSFPYFTTKIFQQTDEKYEFLRFLTRSTEERGGYPLVACQVYYWLPIYYVINDSYEVHSLRKI